MHVLERIISKILQFPLRKIIHHENQCSSSGSLNSFVNKIGVTKKKINKLTKLKIFMKTISTIKKFQSIRFEVKDTSNKAKQQKKTKTKNRKRKTRAVLVCLWNETHFCWQTHTPSHPMWNTSLPTSVNIYFKHHLWVYLRYSRLSIYAIHNSYRIEPTLFRIVRNLTSCNCMSYLNFASWMFVFHRAVINVYSYAKPESKRGKKNFSDCVESWFVEYLDRNCVVVVCWT